LLENLPAHTASGEANGALWYRVTVGPFARKVDANRAMQHLRNQGLQPIMRG
jgi:cell division protein FtsN